MRCTRQKMNGVQNAAAWESRGQEHRTEPRAGLSCGTEDARVLHKPLHTGDARRAIGFSLRYFAVRTVLYGYAVTCQMKSINTADDDDDDIVPVSNEKFKNTNKNVIKSYYVSSNDITIIELRSRRPLRHVLDRGKNTTTKHEWSTAVTFTGHDKNNNNASAIAVNDDIKKRYHACVCSIKMLSSTWLWVSSKIVQ